MAHESEWDARVLHTLTVTPLDKIGVIAIKMQKRGEHAMSMDPMRDLPLGFGMNLMRKPEAMRRFALLPDERRQQIIAHTKQIASKQEMRRYVDTLFEDTPAQ